MSLRAITIPAQVEQPKGLLVGLHGWGANAQDLASLASFLHLPDYQLIFPDAPFSHPYAPQGRMWYGFPSNYSFQTAYDFQDLPELQESRQRLKDWLHSLADSTGIPLSKTILAGFSQGGAMTLDIGLQLPLAALMVLSGYLHAPVQPSFPTLPPVLIVHGRQDAVVPLAAAHHTRNILQNLNVKVEYHEFDMGHEVRPIVLDIMQSFVEERVSTTSETASDR